MSPNNNEVQPSMQLPPPIEQMPGVGGQVNQAPNGAEMAPAPEQLSQGAASAVPGMQTIPLPVAPTMPGAQVAQSQPSSSIATQGNPLTASDDNDLIEKEWVNKAKQIVDHTRDDPYKQSEELTVFKADYMKKRYNKTIKLSK